MERGDNVVFATGPGLGGWVAACGFHAIATGLDADELISRAATAHAGKRSAVYMFTSVAVPPMASDLSKLCARWRPDLIVHEEAEYAAPLVAARLGIPCVTHSWAAPAAQLGRPGPPRE